MMSRAFARPNAKLMDVEVALVRWRSRAGCSDGVELPSRKAQVMYACLRPVTAVGRPSGANVVNDMVWRIEHGMKRDSCLDNMIWMAAVL